jgi:GNAT superfamily N-acetyltransferase
MSALSRPYRGPEDSQRLRSFLIDARATLGHSCWHAGDLAWRLFLHSIRYDLRRMLRLWENAGGDLLAFAILSPPTPKGTVRFDLQVHPSERGHGLEEQMLDWVEAWGPEVAATPPGAPCRRFSTDTGVYDDDVSQIAALECRGFVHARGNGLLLLRPMDDLIPEPPLSSGFAVRAVAGPHEVKARASAHRDAFHPSRVTDEAYLRLMHTSGYTPELDLVVAAPDGTFGAFCLGWLDEFNRVGEFEPVGTRVAFRRLGLARAVLSEGLRRMRACGMASAVVGPISAEDHAAVGLYRSSGFHAIHRIYCYTKER